MTLFLLANKDQVGEAQPARATFSRPPKQHRPQSGRREA
jgi:hypothetical protein